MKKTAEEIVLTFFDGDEPYAIMHSNGSQTFYRLRKMNREDIAQLLKHGSPN